MKRRFTITVHAMNLDTDAPNPIKKELYDFLFKKGFKAVSVIVDEVKVNLTNKRC